VKPSPGNKTHAVNHLGKYFVDMKKKFEWYAGSIHKLDKNGVLLYKVPYTTKYQYYPVDIAQYALGNFEIYLDNGNEHHKGAFLKQADWLVSNITIKPGGFGVWEHDFVLPYYSFKVPWVHGMAQGLAVSVLLRAHQLSGDNAYLESAKKAYGIFEKSMEEGGVRYIDKNGNIWLEEYPVSPPPHILNGFIFALFGVHDFYSATKNEKVLDLWKAGVQTMEENLNLYDLGYWSRYNLVHQHPATKSYHALHVRQLKVLCELSGKTIFGVYADKWEKCLNNPINRGRATLKRGAVHIKRHGIKGSITTYSAMRKWARR